MTFLNLPTELIQICLSHVYKESRTDLLSFIRTSKLSAALGNPILYQYMKWPSIFVEYKSAGGIVDRVLNNERQERYWIRELILDEFDHDSEDEVWRNSLVDEDKEEEGEKKDEEPTREAGEDIGKRDLKWKLPTDDEKMACWEEAILKMESLALLQFRNSAQRLRPAFIKRLEAEHPRIKLKASYTDGPFEDVSQNIPDMSKFVSPIVESFSLWLEIRGDISVKDSIPQLGNLLENAPKLKYLKFAVHDRCGMDHTDASDIVPVRTKKTLPVEEVRLEGHDDDYRLEHCFASSFDWSNLRCLHLQCEESAQFWFLDYFHGRVPNLEICSISNHENVYSSYGYVGYKTKIRKFLLAIRELKHLSLENFGPPKDGPFDVLVKHGHSLVSFQSTWAERSNKDPADAKVWTAGALALVNVSCPILEALKFTMYRPKTSMPEYRDITFNNAHFAASGDADVFSTLRGMPKLRHLCLRMKLHKSETIFMDDGIARPWMKALFRYINSWKSGCPLDRLDCIFTPSEDSDFSVGGYGCDMVACEPLVRDEEAVLATYNPKVYYARNRKLWSDKYLTLNEPQDRWEGWYHWRHTTSNERKRVNEHYIELGWSYECIQDEAGHDRLVWKHFKN